MKPVGVRDPATGRLSALKLTGAPYTFRPTEVTSVCSTATFEVAAFGGMKITVQQAPDAPAAFWTPGQIEIDLISVRALRDACNLFLDRFHDETEADG